MSLFLRYKKLELVRLIQGNTNLLPRKDQVRVFNDLAISLEDTIIFVGITVELLRDLGQIVS